MSVYTLFRVIQPRALQCDAACYWMLSCCFMFLFCAISPAAWHGTWHVIGALEPAPCQLWWRMTHLVDRICCINLEAIKMYPSPTFVLCDLTLDTWMHKYVDVYNTVLQWRLRTASSVLLEQRAQWKTYRIRLYSVQGRHCSTVYMYIRDWRLCEWLKTHSNVLYRFGKLIYKITPYTTLIKLSTY